MALLNEKSWSKDFEKQIYDKWKNDKTYSFIEVGPVYSIDTPPPYVNTPVHIGHATTYVIMDMIARFRRSIGYSVLFPVGMDRNGLPIEIAAEKRFGISMKSMTREQFMSYCEKVLEDSSLASLNTFLRLGISFNSWDLGNNPGDVYYTDSNEYRTLTQSTFIDMWNKGMIYEDNRINNYCKGCGTTLADDEVTYEELPTLMNEIIFTVKETGEELIIGTTRPELICTCAMIIFNPEDERYKKLEGKTAVTPLFNKEVPIKSHPFAEMNFGTGLVMMCSAGDQTDIRFFREMGLPAVIAIDADGKMNKNAGFLEGLAIKEAREKILQDLDKNKLIVKQQKMMHRTPVCERSKDPIEFIAMPEFYLRQLEFRDDLTKLTDKISFFSEKSKQILMDWMNSISMDWAISRRRYYATEIPIWYCKSCGKVHLGEKGKYVRPWKEKLNKKCECGSVEFVGEERVLDTWFDSSITPLYIMKYNEEFFKKHEICSLRPQGKEIVRSWLYYTLLRCFLLTDKHIFKDVWIHHHITDETGRKMSKSIGNIIKPEEILDKFGSEPFRLWAASEGNLDQTDFKCSFERIEGEMKTLTKLWNVVKFVNMFNGGNDKSLTETDNWIIKEMNDLIEYSRERYLKYDFHNPTIKIKHFLWEIFAPHYIELVKNRAYNQKGIFTKEEQDAAIYTLKYCLNSMLKLLSPIIPMITYAIYLETNGIDIHSEKFPDFETINTSLTTEEVMDLNSHIWKVKKDKSLSLKSEITEATIPIKFRPIEKDIVATHNIKKLNYGDYLEIIL